MSLCKLHKGPIGFQGPCGSKALGPGSLKDTKEISSPAIRGLYRSILKPQIFYYWDNLIRLTSPIPHAWLGQPHPIFQVCAIQSSADKMVGIIIRIVWTCHACVTDDNTLAYQAYSDILPTGSQKKIQRSEHLWIQRVVLIVSCQLRSRFCCCVLEFKPKERHSHLPES